MQALSRSPMSDTHFFIRGDVSIDPSAAIAPGVLLQADPGAAIVIRAGVCIGRGAILHACAGSIDLGEGVTLGAGVLIFGCSTVGSGACLGAGVTLMDQAIAAGQMVPANSVLSPLEVPQAGARAASGHEAQSRGAKNAAEASKPQSESQSSQAVETSPRRAAPSPYGMFNTNFNRSFTGNGGDRQEQATHLPGDGASAESSSGSALESEQVTGGTKSDPSNSVSQASPSSGSPAAQVQQDVQVSEVHTREVNLTTQRVVYGRDSLERIMTMMFPHRQPLGSPPGETSSSPTDAGLDPPDRSVGS
jgi:carbon dioxide concentrating mechanism protein CcmN